MPLVGFEPTILVSERPQTHALDRAATGIGKLLTLHSPNHLHGLNSTVCVTDFRYIEA
jgi:hypothetical protein